MTFKDNFNHLIKKINKNSLTFSYYILCFCLIFIFGTSLSLFIFQIIKNKKDSVQSVHFFRESETLTQSIERFFHKYSVSLDFIPYLFESKEKLSYSEFMKHTQAIKKMDKDMIIEYMPFIKKRDILSFENKAKSLFPDYTLKKADTNGRVKKMTFPNDRNYFFPLYYTSHTDVEENKNFLGFDVFSSPVHRDALIQAVETGKKAVTEPFFLLREGQTTYQSFIVFKAIYDTTLPRNTKEERWAATLGVVTAVIKMDSLLKQFFNFKEKLYKKNQAKMHSQVLDDGEGKFHYDLSFFYLSQNQYKLIYSLKAHDESLEKTPNKLNSEKFYEEFIYEEGKEELNVIGGSFFSTPSLVYFHKYNWMGRHLKWLITFREKRPSWIVYWDAYLVLFFGLLLTCFFAQWMVVLLRRKNFFQRELGLRNKQIQYDKRYYSTLLNTVFEALICIDEVGTIQFANPSAERVFGYKLKELLGKNVKMLMPKEHRVKHDAYLARYKKTGERHVVGKKKKELEGVRKNGEVFPLSLAINEVKMEGGKVFIGSIEDLSQEKKIGREMQETIEKLSQANSDLESFNYIASHDLQEPLRVVSNFTELLKEKLSEHQDLDEKTSRYMGFIVSSVKRMKILLEDLMEYSRGTHSSSQIKEIALDNVISNILKNLQNLIKDSGAEIIYENLPMITSESTVLRCLFQNLIENGIKYRKKNCKPYINIKAKEKRGQWLFSVSDNGIGIKKDYFAQIFLPFKRLHSQEEYLGSGVGLALCSKIIGNLRGSIWVESEEGKGSTFYFTIPKIHKSLKQENGKASA